MTHIFISYAKKDTKSLAMDLAENLNALENVSAWVDVEGIDYGDEWETLIQRQIARCDYMVVLYSPDINRHIDDESQTESYVIKEIRYAQMRKKPIIPVMAQDTEPPMSLISIQYIDYANEGISSSELVNRLCKRMKINLVSQVDTPQKSQIAIPPKPKIILPKPFDWCYIPAGRVSFSQNDVYDNNFYAKDEMTVDVPAFYMAKYPVTNAQFRLFIQDGGYNNDRFWTPAGIAWRNNHTQPYYWDDSKWNGDEYPVVGVSWYEGVAFCNWVSQKSGQQIMLPSDVMWQRAAQGDDKRVYPWGNTWDANLCNNNVDKKGVGKTTPVYQYEDKYTHPYGLVDMAGNVWEWCLTTYKTGENHLQGDDSDLRVMMGGSWYTEDVGRFSCTFRYRLSPFDRNNTGRGFRIARF